MAEVLNKVYLQDEMEFWKIPGVAISVIQDDEVMLSEGFGYRDVEKKLPVTSQTQFGIASCSKSFTSVIIAALVDQGLLDYDKPIKEYFPEFEMYDPVATQYCCLRDMLAHRTGLAPHEAIWASKICDRADVWRRLKYLKPMSEFRKETLYNNNIYTLIGHIAEKVTGKTWDELVYEICFDPLGMTNSNTSTNDMVKTPDYATPYWEGLDGVVRPIDVWNVDLGAPAAGINTCADDFIKWIKFHLHEGKWGDEQLISKKNMREMHTEQAPEELYPWKYPETLPIGGYGMAWFIENYRGDDLIFHLGEIEGYCSFEGFLPDKNIGITLMMNLHKPCGPFICSIVYHIIDNLLKREPIDWSSRLRPWNRRYEGLYYHWDVNLLSADPVSGTSLSHAPEAYVGTYHDPGYGDFTVEYDGTNWKGLFNGYEHEMEHYHYDVFKLYNVKGDTILITAPLAFITDPFTGQINAFEAKLDPDTDPILFKKK